MCKNVAQVLHANTFTAKNNLSHFLYNSPNDHGLKFYTRSNKYNLKGKIIFSSGQKIHDVWWSPFVARFQVCASKIHTCVLSSSCAQVFRKSTTWKKGESWLDEDFTCCLWRKQTYWPFGVTRWFGHEKTIKIVIHICGDDDPWWWCERKEYKWW